MFLVVCLCWWLIPTARRQVAAFRQLAHEMGGTFSRSFFVRFPRVRVPYGSGWLVVELSSGADDTQLTLVTLEGLNILDRKFSLEITPETDLDELEMREDGVLAVRELLTLAPMGRVGCHFFPKGLLGPAKAIAAFDGYLADRKDFVTAVRTIRDALERIAAALV
jgi:hypothetical protein